MAKSKTTTSSSIANKTSAGVASLKPAELRKAIIDADKDMETNHIRLAELLYTAYHKDFYVQWGYDEGKKGFETFCSTEMNTGYRKAMYLVEVWEAMKNLSISKRDAVSLGWTKLKDIAAVATKETVEEWIKKAKEMSTRDLTEAVKITRRSDTSGGGVPSVTTMTLKMSESEANIIMEAIEEAKKVTESDNAVVALEMICQDWMQEKGSSPERTTIEDIIGYVKEVYDVGLVIAGEEGTDKPKEKTGATEKKAPAKKKAAAKKKTTKKEETPPKDDSDKGDADVDDMLNGKGEGKGGDSGDASQDIDELLGIS